MPDGVRDSLLIFAMIPMLFSGSRAVCKTGEGGGAGAGIEYLPFRRVPLIPAADIPLRIISCVARFGFDFNKSLYNSRYFPFFFFGFWFLFCFEIVLVFACHF